MNTNSYKIQGMTCGGCKAKVEHIIGQFDGVESVDVDLSKGQAIVKHDKPIPFQELVDKLAPRYTLTEAVPAKSTSATPSKLAQLRPLIIILTYVAVTSVLLHLETLSWSSMMLDFMGIFLVVFAFFKLLDVKGFANSFAMYDPLAAIVPSYGKIYPFLETTLGILFLFRYQLDIAIIATLVLLTITTIGVVKTLRAKRSIKCACLGTTLNLPMTEATLIENSIMILMGLTMLFSRNMM